MVKLIMINQRFGWRPSHNVGHMSALLRLWQSGRSHNDSVCDPLAEDQQSVIHISIIYKSKKSIQVDISHWTVRADETFKCSF